VIFVHPEYYVLPRDIVKAAQDPKSKWGKAFLRNMEEPLRYLENWESIKGFLSLQFESDSPQKAIAPLIGSLKYAEPTNG
jgi:hypothetical protein